MAYLVALALAVGFALTIAAIIGAISQSKAVQAGLEGMARQPEAAGSIQTAMIIGLAFIESLVIYVLVVTFIMMGRLPETKEIVETLKGAKPAVTEPAQK
jgi:F-type H+-transporting ATPase subunit c